MRIGSLSRFGAVTSVTKTECNRIVRAAAPLLHPSRPMNVNKVFSSSNLWQEVDDNNPNQWVVPVGNVGNAGKES